MNPEYSKRDRLVAPNRTPKIVPHLKIERKSNGFCELNCAPLPPKAHENELGLLTDGMIPNRYDANPLRAKSLKDFLEVIRTCYKLSIRDSAVIGACNGDPRTHAHLSANLLSAQ